MRARAVGGSQRQTPALHNRTGALLASATLGASDVVGDVSRYRTHLKQTIILVTEAAMRRGRCDRDHIRA